MEKVFTIILTLVALVSIVSFRCNAQQPCNYSIGTPISSSQSSAASARETDFTPSQAKHNTITCSQSQPVWKENTSCRLSVSHGA